MINKIIMPKLGFTMTDGTIVKWLKAEGEDVKVGEILFEVETDKVVTEVEASASGILRKILAPEGESINIGEVIAIIAGENDVLSDEATHVKDDSVNVNSAGNTHHIDLNWNIESRCRYTVLITRRSVTRATSKESIIPTLR